MEKDKYFGRVVWFDAKKGFGFLACPDFPKDVFCHWAHIVSEEEYKTLDADAMVSFMLDKNDQGIMATQIQVVKEKDDGLREAE